MQMTENRYSEVIQAIANQDGVSEEYVYLQLQQAINAGYYSQDPEVQEYWKKIAPDGEIPSPEQLIEVLTKKIKK